MRVLHDALRPPDGYELDCAVGTTFTLDLISLLSVPLATGRFTRGEESADEYDPLELLASIQRAAERITLFHQAGAVRKPERHRELLTLIEDSLVGVALAPGRLFHPKLWVARYAGADRSSHYRLVVLSRNLTPDRCWDTLVVVEGETRRAYVRESKPVSDLLQWLARQPATPQDRRTAVRDLARSIRRVRFEAPVPFRSIHFRPLGIRGYGANPVATARRDRVLLVSPYIGSGQLQRLSAGTSSSVLVTRPEELARLPDPSPSAVASIFQLDDALEPEPEDDVHAEASLVGLHAKVFCADQGWDATIWTGSANATEAGFGGNVEFLVEMTGRKSMCGVDALLGDGSPGTFSSMLQPIDRLSEKPPDDELEQRLDALAARIAALPLVAVVDETPLGWRMRLENAGAVALPPEADIRLSPLASRTRPRVLDLASTPVAEFDGLADYEISGLFVVEIRMIYAKGRREFVARWPMTGTLPDRVRALLGRLITDRERLIAFLRLLLGTATDGFGSGGQTNGPGGGIWGALAGGTPILELLVRTLAASPERLDALARWVPELAAAADGDVAADLLAVWEPVWKARQEMTS